eukprot:gene4253-4819_t
MPLISSLLGISTRTVGRRMAEYGLRSRSYYSTHPDAEPDALTGNIMHEFPTVGWHLVFHGGIDGYTRMIDG